MSKLANHSCDLLIIGSGLAGLSLAYCYHKKHPQNSIILLEEQASLLANRTWSCHEKDLEPFEFWRPFLDHIWNSYDVYFQNSRHVKGKYFSIRSESFFKKMSALLGEYIHFNATVTNATATQAITQNGEVYEASVVIDTRPPSTLTLESMKAKGWGFQKFVGLEVTLQDPHGLERPVLMDTRVEQQDGYRFFYLLPYESNKLLIEETYYSNDPRLPSSEYHQNILNYANSKGWHIVSIDRQEQGVLPIPTSSALLETPKKNEPLRLGAGAGFYHPVTGYSLLWSSKVAKSLGELPVFTRPHLEEKMRDLLAEFKRTEGFYLLLNKLLFFGSTTKNRKAIFERFYRFSEKTIARFYSGTTNWLDRIKLLVGKPPIPVSDGVRAMLVAPPQFRTVTKGEDS